MNLARNLLQLFSRRERIRLLGISVLLLIASLLEVIGIGVILPLITIIAEAEQVAGILKFCIVLPTELLVILGLVVVLFVAHPLAALGGTVLLGAVGWGLSSLTRRRLARLGKTRSDQHARMIQCVNQSL